MKTTNKGHISPQEKWMCVLWRQQRPLDQEVQQVISNDTKRSLVFDLLILMLVFYMSLDCSWWLCLNLIGCGWWLIDCFLLMCLSLLDWYSMFVSLLPTYNLVVSLWCGLVKDGKIFWFLIEPKLLLNAYSQANLIHSALLLLLCNLHFLYNFFLKLAICFFHCPF